jgi:hypothetical protein
VQKNIAIIVNSIAFLLSITPKARLDIDYIGWVFEAMKHLQKRFYITYFKCKKKSNDKLSSLFWPYRLAYT